MTHTPDDLDRLLSPVPGRPAPVGDAAELLQATTRVVRRRVAVRRALGGGGVAAVFACGLAAGWLLAPRPQKEVVFVPLVKFVPAVEPGSPAEPPGPSAAELELRAEQSDDSAEVARLYRQAGDTYLTAEKDYAQAARCYRLHLLTVDPDGRKIAAADSWLLISMKETRP